jgi:hypothetical protein
MLPEGEYSDTFSDVVALLEEGQRAAARSINALMTATYWPVGPRIVESEQGGQGRAAGTPAAVVGGPDTAVWAGLRR